MSYVKDRFLNMAYSAACVGAYYEQAEKESLRKKALKEILKAYRSKTELKGFLICKRVAELAEFGTVGDTVIIGRWRQLSGILEHYRKGAVTDIGLTASVMRTRRNEQGAATSGQSFFIHDRGDGHIELEGPIILREQIKKVLDGIDSKLPREKFFASIPKTLEKLGAKEQSYLTEIKEYLYINGRADNGLLKISPNSFNQDDFYTAPDEQPEEYLHFCALLDQLAIDQLRKLVTNCGLENNAINEAIRFYDDEADEDRKQQQIRVVIKERLWSADREDFYREYSRLVEI